MQNQENTIKNTHLDTPKAANSIKFQSEIPITTPTLPYMKQTATSILKDINEHWLKIYETPFTKVLTKIPECKIMEKISSGDRKKRLRTMHKKVKDSIEKSWTSDGKDTNTFYGTRQSRSRYNKHRSSLFFESKAKTNESKYIKFYGDNGTHLNRKNCIRFFNKYFKMSILVAIIYYRKKEYDN